MYTKRVVFNLNNYVLRLNESLQNSPENIHDIVSTYKNFLKRLKKPLLENVKKYVNNHPIVIGSERVKSYIDHCHNYFL